MRNTPKAFSPLSSLVYSFTAALSTCRNLVAPSDVSGNSFSCCRPGTTTTGATGAEAAAAAAAAFAAASSASAFASFLLFLPSFAGLVLAAGGAGVVAA